MQNLMNCYQHNSTTTHICTKLDCKNKLACNSCVNQQHVGHIDNNVIPIKKFVDRMLYEFQKSEIDRLKRVYYKEDIILHINKEFQYLRDKIQQILNQREQKLISLINSQWIHSKSLKNIIDHVEMMRDGKVYEEGLQVVLPILTNGTQDTLNKYERDKIRVVTKVREQINQVKTVMDGLFYIGNQYQMDQQQMKLENTFRLEHSLKQSEDRLFQSAVHLSQPKEFQSAKPYGTYQEFVDSLYPEKQHEYIQTIDYTSLLKQPVKFESQQLQFEKSDSFQLFGVIDHIGYVMSSIRLQSGQIVTCSKVVSFFEYPSLKLMQQIGNNQNFKQVVELTSNLIALLTQQQILMYEKRKDRWVPKGEFNMPYTGILYRFGLVKDLFVILCQTQLLVYKLKQSISVDQPIEYLFVHQTPLIYMHKYDCCSYSITDNRLFTADLGGRLYHWKLGNVFSVEKVIQSSNSEIISIIPLHDTRVITVGIDGVLRLWDAALELQSTQKHRSPFSAATSAKELDQFYTGDISGKIQKWRVSLTIESLIELDAHNDQVTDLYFSQYLISSSADKKTKIWLV